MLHCFSCGSDLPDNVIFCLHCGERLDAGNEFVTQLRGPQSRPIQKSFTWLWVKTIAAGVCLLLGVGGVIFIIASIFATIGSKNTFDKSSQTNTYDDSLATPRPTTKKTVEKTPLPTRESVTYDEPTYQPANRDGRAEVNRSMANTMRAANYVRDYDRWVSAKCRDGSGESRRLAWGIAGMCRENGGVLYWETPPPSMANAKRP